MKGVIDSIKGEYYRCLLENGDLLNIHSSEFSEPVKIGDIIKIRLELNSSENNSK